MKPEQVDQIVASLEAFDTRLSSVDKRFVAAEGHLADGARAGDEMSRSIQKLTDLYLSIDIRLGNIETLLGNYVEATKERTRQARVSEEAAKGLISEVRKRCPEAIGE